ncbi:hypothetical protein ATO13_02550 [Stappia sp. 22II-S9-Z10]|nr:hypothetical protein ATO13_02550 [Stappia sp. 22II-S9-Z10]
MAIHSVFVSPRNRDGAGVDLRLRVLFNDVYRVGSEFWLIDSARDAETVTRLIRTILSPGDKTFVAVLSRDVCSGLSANAHAWLNAPDRNWGRSAGRGMGEMAPDEARMTASHHHAFAA